MAVKATYTIWIEKRPDIVGVTKLYKRVTTFVTPDPPTVKNPTDWLTTEPTYSGTNPGYLYYVERTDYTDDTFVYSNVSLDSSYEMGKDNYNRSTAAQASATEANNKIDNLEIGGRNLLLGYVKANGATSLAISRFSSVIYEQDSTAPSGWRMACTINSITEKAHIYLTFLRTKLMELGIKHGDELTLSYYAKTDSETMNQTIRGGLECATNTVVIEDPVLSTEWQRISFKCKFSETTTYQAFYIINSKVYDSMSIGEHIYISSIKIERGNKVTDWTPAPEDVESSIQDVTNYIDQNVEVLQQQIDGAIQFWNSSDIPTVNNYPASNWTTEEEKTNHIADIYTVIQDVQGELKQGKGYRFDKVNNNWVWVEITDNELSAVQALASSKAKVYVTTPTVPYSIGDLWLKDNKLYKCKINKDSSGSYSLSDWELATDYTNDSKALEVEQQLNNLEIGARNLLIGSSKYREDMPNSVTPLTNDYYTTSFLTMVANVIKGETYTLQCVTDGLWSNHATSSAQQDPTTTERYCTIWIVSRSSDNEEAVGLNRCFTGNCVETGKKSWMWESTITGKVYIRLNTYGAGNPTVNFWDMKLERGDKATDWTPAPEDIDDNIKDIEDKFDNENEEINKKIEDNVKELDDKISDKVSKEELNAALSSFASSYKLASIDPDKINGVITALASGNSEGKYSILQQNGDGYTFGMGDVIKALQENAKDLDDLKKYNLEDLENELKDLSKSRTYIRFTETVEDGETKSTIILGTKDSPFQVRITNTSIDFLENTGRTQEKFELLKNKPKDWDTNYQNYYILSNDEYIHISEETAPTWEANTYYELINEPIYNRLAYANNNTFFNEKTVVKEEIQIVKEDNQGNVKRIYLENKS